MQWFKINSSNPISSVKICQCTIYECLRLDIERYKEMKDSSCDDKACKGKAWMPNTDKKTSGHENYYDAAYSNLKFIQYKR